MRLVGASTRAGVVWEQTSGVFASWDQGDLEAPEAQEQARRQSASCYLRCLSRRQESASATCGVSRR